MPSLVLEKNQIKCTFGPVILLYHGTVTAPFYVVCLWTGTYTFVSFTEQVPKPVIKTEETEVNPDAFTDRSTK